MSTDKGLFLKENISSNHMCLFSGDFPWFAYKSLQAQVARSAQEASSSKKRDERPKTVVAEWCQIQLQTEHLDDGKVWVLPPSFKPRDKWKLAKNRKSLKSPIKVGNPENHHFSLK